VERIEQVIGVNSGDPEDTVHSVMDQGADDRLCGGQITAGVGRHGQLRRIACIQLS
jgi:hypothetical protein